MTDRVLLFYSLAVLNAFYLIRSVDRSKRFTLGMKIFEDALFAGTFAYIFVVLMIRRLSELGLPHYALPVLFAIEGALAGFVVQVSPFPKILGTGRKAETFRGASFLIIILSAALASGFWVGELTFNFSYYLRMGMVSVVSFWLVLPILFSIEWRLSITQVPARLRGEGIFIISAGLLAGGLLGLSGLF